MQARYYTFFHCYIALSKPASEENVIALMPRNPVPALDSDPVGDGR